MPQNGPTILRIAIPSPLRRTFDYTLPEDLRLKLDERQPLPGMRVNVEFGRRIMVGLIVGVSQCSEIARDKLKDISDIIDVSPIVPSDLFELFIWSAYYYQHPIGEALFTALPTLLRKGGPAVAPRIPHWKLTQLGAELDPQILKRAAKQQKLIDVIQQNNGCVAESEINSLFSSAVRNQLKDKGLIESVLIEQKAKASTDEILNQPSLKLDSQQKIALNAIDLHSFNSYLLEGVTGSGKTEIYLQAIEQALRYERQALVLIPEISLTPQTEKRFRDRFNANIVTLHSKMTDNQRLEAWLQARSGQAKIVLGTRSAIFTPFKNLGLIVMDEEHDSSYKQQDGFRYSARDLAVIRAQRNNIPAILGSATPSLESLNNCNQGRYKHLTLDKRANSAKAPDWSVVDLKTESIECGIANTTLDAIDATLKAKQQVLVFLNRRGFAPTLLCHQCGWTAKCQNCDSKLTVHKARGRLICHHCGYQQRQINQCPSCNSTDLMAAGEGTERSEDFLQQRFPDYPIVRVDRDSTRKKGALEAFFATADSGEPCVLVGTQILAKGHHFENVTLVVILDADSGLMSADFRSHERMGQLLTQVAGRSGRGKLSGQVIVQTHQPEHPVLDQLFNQGYRPLAQQLLSQRQQGQLPPFRALAVIRAESSYPKLATDFLSLARQISQQHAVSIVGIDLLGPLPALMEKRSGRYRFILQITSAKRSNLQQLLTEVAGALEKNKKDHKLRWSFDVDPQEL
ncbi:MAG: primosomal protein N' [Cellvibrionales bacterium TMED47]|nr:primosomal protein N' [Porticoccaceae bacterium]RPG83822.1 MAG: primosomal protein N' [Cellvibrionales bacterium TMED47]